VSSQPITRPQMAPYRRHILICYGSFCDPGGSGQRLYQRLAQELQDRELLFGPDRVKRGLTPCLGVCVGGPILVVYPDGIWYGGLDEPLLLSILDAIEQDAPLPEERCFYRLPG
jgi:(2Fe-2S) ferredoxin